MWASREYPDLRSLVEAAQRWKFRTPAYPESLAEYRKALADFVEPKDLGEAHEIRTGKQWDHWSEDELRDFFRRTW